MAAAAQQAASISEWDIMAGIILAMMFFSGIARICRNLAAAHREQAEVRHRRRLELAYARAAHRMRSEPALHPDAEPLPSAVIPAPPGAFPANRVPGRCRHERIVPVITDGGDVRRWLCANYPRCTAEFDADTALYEAPGETR
jgi:hypothetical protein